MKSVLGAQGRVQIPASRSTALATAIAAIVAVSSPAWAEPAQSVYEFNIPSGDLGDALRAFGTTADTQILFSPEVVRGRRNAPVQGRLSVNQAMGSLLSNTELTFSAPPPTSSWSRKPNPARQRGRRLPSLHRQSQLSPLRMGPTSSRK